MEPAADASPIEACELCSPNSKRAKTEASAATGILFVGEVPDSEELGRGGPDENAGDQFLTRIIENGIGVKRADVYIMKLIKRAPSGDRIPQTGELALCSSCLSGEITRIAPKVIVPLGEHAARELTQKALPLERLRSETHILDGRPVIPTYSPVAVLRKEGSSDFAHIKKLVWEDIKRAMSEAEITPGH
jgi:DNA polymerase